MSRRSNENENGPPWNKDAERAVLGSMIHENNVIPAVLAIVQASDFYADYHQKIFRAIADLDKRQQPIDLVLLAEELVKRDQLKDIGGGSYLADLWDTAATAANAEYYAHLVRDYSARRGLIYLGKDTAYKAELGTAPVSELIEATRGELTSLEKVSTPVAAIPEYDADQLAHSEHGEHLDYLPLLGQEGYLVRRWSHLVAGYPRSGKTELLSACCRDWLALGERVLYLTEEPLDIWRPRLARAQEAWKGMKLVTAFGMGLAAIHKRLRDGPESIVILDTIRGLGIVHGDENDNAASASS